MADRTALGKAVRKVVPLESHSELELRPSRDPVGLLLSQAQGRVPELMPIRYGRMLVSPFTYYRGAALVMADDLACTVATGLSVQLCGDAHLSNFGAYASPERRLVFDINDFDETLPGPFEWDVKRLATSFVVAGRENGFSPKQCRAVAVSVVRNYRETMRVFSKQSILAVWYAHLDIENVIARYRATLSPAERKRKKAMLVAVDATMSKAHARDNLQALGKLTAVADGRRRIVPDPPLVVPMAELADVDAQQLMHQLNQLVVEYRATLRSDRRHLLDHFSLTDVAHKVVGVGSVGTRAWILLLEAPIEAGTLLLQAKQAGDSVLAPYIASAVQANQGERVVAGQRMMQATSDIFLGWLRADTSDGEQDYYVRQLRDWKMSVDIGILDPDAMNLYARLCGWTLARAHARSGDRFAIASYLGKSDRFDQAVTTFATAYADQTTRDHATLQQAVTAGRVVAEPGV